MSDDRHRGRDRKVENLYRAVTGRDVPESKAPHAPIPAERDPVEHVQEQMDRLTQLLSTTGSPSVVQSTWIPPMSVWESPEETLVCLDLPGVTRQGLEVNVQANVIVVTGRRQPPQATGPTKLELRRAEQPMGVFRRMVPMPPQARPEQMTAALSDGALTLRIPRDPQATQSVRNVPVT